MRIALGPLPLARVAAAARALDAQALEVAWLPGEGWGDATLAIAPCDERRIALGAGALDEAAGAIDALVSARAPFLGYVAYEAARALERPAWAYGGARDTRDTREAPTGAAAILRRYGATLRWSPATGLAIVEGPDAIAVSAIRRALERAAAPTVEPDPGAEPTLELHPVDDDDAHRARVERALAYIAAGDLYVVNVARAFDGPAEAPATALLGTMLRRTSAPFAASIDLGDHALASTSPELFLRISPRDDGELEVRTSPIKGTRPRGRDAHEDAAIVDELRGDPKERAELVMIVDLERNDLGKVARIGQVQPAPAPRLLTTRTVHHLVHDVDALVDARVGHGAIVAATLPSGSVTGAPKVRAMEIIAGLEGARRGLYCGAILQADARGELVASMAIRTVVVDRRTATARYFAGGGIVADSDPVREVAETRWKALQVTAGPPTRTGDS